MQPKLQLGGGCCGLTTHCLYSLLISSTYLIFYIRLSIFRLTCLIWRLAYVSVWSHCDIVYLLSFSLVCFRFALTLHSSKLFKPLSLSLWLTNHHTTQFFNTRQERWISCLVPLKSRRRIIIIIIILLQGYWTSHH